MELEERVSARLVRVRVVHEADALDGTVLFELAAELALGDLVREPANEERLRFREDGAV